MDMGGSDREAYVPLIKATDEEEISRVECGGANAVIPRRWWWDKFLDVEEAKGLILLSMPMILTNVFDDLITLVSVMFAGHLGEVELAASNLANSWAFVTGFTFMGGLSGALDTLCGQGYGARLYKMLGIHLQASCIISFFFAMLVSILWLHSDFILKALHQDPYVSEVACLYLKYLTPGLFAYGFLQNILRFLEMQSVALPLVVCSLLPLIIHIGITYTLVHCTPLAFKGAALSASISLWISVLILVAYTLHAKRFKHTWSGLSSESFRFIFVNLKLALVSAAMECLEDWAFQLLVLLAGLLPNAKRNTPLIAMCANIANFSFMFACGLATAASTRVSNALGAGNAGRARHVMAVALKLATLVAIVVILALFFGNSVWAGFFSDNSVIVDAFSSMRPLLAVSTLLDLIQGTLSGVTRGCGWQHIGVCINLVTFYLIGMPIAVLLGFRFKLHAQGLWIGLICGLVFQNIGLLLLTKWARIKLPNSPSVDNIEEEEVA